MNLFLSLVVLAQLAPPTHLMAWDRPNDAGKAIELTWQLSPDDSVLTGYEVLRISAQGVEKAGFVGPGVAEFTNLGCQDGVEYRYQVVGMRGPEQSPSGYSAPVRSSAQWFNTVRVNVLIGVIVFSSIVVWFIRSARAGRRIFIRRIPGLDALEEAVGRATEMGRPVLYVPGIASVADIGTIAGLNILGEVGKKTAQYETTLLVPNRDPVVYTVAREVVREAYTSVGRPDAFNPDNVYFVTEEQFGYAAAVCGTMVRDRPATNLFFGMFWAESLILAETGASTGAIQIAGTDSVHQLPFFIPACDYTLIGEELYAASAYLSREPVLLGSIKGQDYGKLIILGLLILSSILSILGFAQVWEFFSIG
jgi:hypothetical protein